MSFEVEAELVLELWNAVRDFIPAGKRDAVAEEFLSKFENFGVDPAELVDVVDEDRNLSNAYQELYGAEIDEVYDDGDDDDYDELDFN
jgi:hypothetical protein